MSVYEDNIIPIKARLALELSQIDKSVLEEKGLNALRYYNKHYVKEDCLRRLDIVMGL